MFEPIERKKVYELVAERLVQEISDRRLNPGDELPRERQLAEAYRVGRSSVREALRMLESRGLIAAPGGGRLVVADYTNPLNQSLALLLRLHDGDLRELFEVRRILEVESAGLAALRRTDQDLEAMRAALRSMRQGLRSAERYVGGDVHFHLAVAAATHNRMATYVMQAIRDVLHRALLSIYHIPGSPQRSIGQHDQILAAITDRRAELAREQMRRHLLRVEDDIDKALGASGGRPVMQPAEGR
jgi:GntR family transcriptional regulator, transcriptional repressor for pyruvate dehydrogenase complex